MTVVTTNKFTMKHDLYSEIIDKIDFCLAKEKNKTYEKVVLLMNIVQAFWIQSFKYMERVSFLS